MYSTCGLDVLIRLPIIFVNTGQADVFDGITSVLLGQTSELLRSVSLGPTLDHVAVTRHNSSYKIWEILLLLGSPYIETNAPIHLVLLKS